MFKVEFLFFIIRLAYDIQLIYVAIDLFFNWLLGSLNHGLRALELGGKWHLGTR